MKSKKVRRHSGWISSRLTISKKELIDQDLFVDLYYSKWDNYRDGFRDWYSDFKKIKKGIPYCRRIFSDKYIKKRLQMNTKQEKLLKRRRLRKFKI